MSKIFNDITETIGNTLLVRLNRTAKKHGVLADVNTNPDDISNLLSAS